MFDDVNTLAWPHDILSSYISQSSIHILPAIIPLENKYTLQQVAQGIYLCSKYIRGLVYYIYITAS